MRFPKFSRNFWIISFGLFFFISSFNVIMPELNDYLSSLHPNGKYLLGLIILIFSISAALSRPFSGKLSDYIGRKKVMYIGASIGIISCLLYPLMDYLSPVLAITMFFLLRFIHGFCAGFLPTGATALVTDILPPKQRGIGMGIWGTFISIGFGSGQMLSSWITNHWGLTALFVVAAGFAFLSFLSVALLSETLPNPQRYDSTLLRITKEDVVEPSVRPAATVMFLAVISTGVLFVIAPEISNFLDLNKGWFFGFYVISTIVVRLFASSLSDRIGRRPSLVIGQSFLLISMIILSTSMTFPDHDTKVLMFSIGATVFGISTGISSPTLFAWNADLSAEHRRGVGAGTMFIALETGIIIGSFSTMLTYDNSDSSIWFVFFIPILSTMASVSYLAWHLTKRESKT